MHIPAHVLEPVTCVATGAASAAAIGYALHRVRGETPRRAAPLVGATAACVFAVQMLNFPVSGGTSGHVVGAVFAAMLLGPWAGMLTVSLVLLVQAVLFQDGGISVLGANIWNMAVIGSGVGYAIYCGVSRAAGGFTGRLMAAAFASWAAVVLGAASCAGQLSFAPQYQLVPALTTILPVHSLIGVGEALATAAALVCILIARPDALYATMPENQLDARPRKLLVPGLVAALFMAAALSPFASSLPDGLEVALARLTPAAAGPVATLLWTPLADYQIRALPDFAFAGSIAGVIGTLVVFVAAVGLSRYGLRPAAVKGVAGAIR